MKFTLAQVLPMVDEAIKESLGSRMLTTSERTGLLTAIADKMIAIEFWKRDRRLQNERADKERATNELVKQLTD